MKLEYQNAKDKNLWLRDRDANIGVDGYRISLKKHQVD